MLLWDFFLQFSDIICGNGEKVHITKGMGYHVGIRDTSPYFVVKAKKKKSTAEAKYNSHDPYKT